MAPSLIATSGLNRKITDKLVTPFNIMTTFYFRRSVEKAFQLDEQPSELSLNLQKPLTSNPPFITSAVDDVLFIVNQVVDRSLATSQKAVISSVLPTLARVLGSDFIGMIQRKMRDESYPKAPMQGIAPPEQIIIAFLVLLNNLDVAIDYVKRIVRSRVESNDETSPSNSGQSASSTALTTLFPLSHDSAFVATALRSLQNTFECKSLELINDGVHVIFKNVMKPRLRPVLADAFRDIDYQMSKEELEELRRDTETDDHEINLQGKAVPHHFERGWDLLTKPVIRLLTSRNYEKLLVAMSTYLGEVLEKRIWSYFGRLEDLGAVRLERDITSIAGIVVRGGRYSLRDAFSRCIQICLVMNMENEEWEEFQAAPLEIRDGELEWKITHEERTRARAMVKGRR